MGLTGKFYGLLAALALVAALTGAAGLQTWRLGRAQADLTQARNDLTHAQADLKAAGKVIADRDVLIRANADRAAAEATELADLFRTSCKGAFNAGYASRRCNDPGADAGGVLPDLRQAQSVGAFQASRSAGDLPAEPRR